MDDAVYLHMKRARDGGLSITEIAEDNIQTLVFAGNVKDATEYFGKRATELASPSQATQKTPFESIPKPRVSQRHLDGNPNVIPVSARTLADRLIERDLDQHYADASGQ